MRKTFSILDNYGGVTQQFDGTLLTLKDGLVEIWDHDTKRNIGYVKAIHCLAPGTTICDTEEIDG